MAHELPDSLVLAITDALLLLLDHQPPQFSPSLERHNKIRSRLRQEAHDFETRYDYEEETS